MKEQQELTEEMKRYVTFMKVLGFALKFGGCALLIVFGWLWMLKTSGHFGDVLILLGAYWMLKGLDE